MLIAITAASGRLGSAVIRHLRLMPASQQIVAVARDAAKLQSAGIEIRAGDYQSEVQMTAALQGVDTALLISAPVAGRGDRLQMHRNVIQAALNAGVRKVIYTSVIGNERVEATSFAEFQSINRATETALMESGLEWIVARNGLYLDLDLLHILHADQHGGVYRNNGGEGRCGYISIDELGFALASLALSDDCNGQVVNLVGELHTQAELVEFANQVLGLNVRYEPITLEQNIARFMADERIAARGEQVARMLSGCFESIAAGGFEVSSDYERATGRPARSIPEQIAALKA